MYRRSHPGRALARRIQIYPRDFRVGSHAEVRKADQRRQHACLRTCLQIVAATKAFAETAEGALPKLHTELIRKGLAEIRGWLRERLVTCVARRLREQRRAIGLLKRRRRIFRQTPTL